MTEGSGSGDQRVLVLGAETEYGRAVAAALAGAGVRLALVSGSPGASAAFAVQRLARRLGALAHALPAGNEAAFRVMARQVAKALGGLDALVFCLPDAGALAWALRYVGREIVRSGGGVAVAVADPAAVGTAGAPEGLRLVCIAPSEPLDQAVQQVAAAVARGFPGG